MTDNEWLAAQFEQNRPHLRKVAYRMLGSLTEAEDAVQEGWLRLSRSDTSAVENLSGWLTTVVARVCLDALRTRESRRESSLDASDASAMPARDGELDPEHEAQLADSVGLALLVVLETLEPAERVAFVLHDMFDLPFAEIAPIVGRSRAAARQLASRARRRVQGAGGVKISDRARQRGIVDAFLAASRGGDFSALLAMLDPGVALRADAATVRTGAEPEVAGAEAVAKTFAGRARAARLALIDGAAGLVWSMGGEPKVAFLFTIEEEKITAIDLVGDPERLRGLDLKFLD
ncbi:MAG TPA: sigma-70 family RNA polymerase sigma factor [Gemmatimonadaceae bacterium]|jgi:RNA polymerase sigma-70 factor (ECF subfamily)